MPDPQLVTPAATATFAGASALVLAISTVARRVTRLNTPLVPLIVALIVSFAVSANQETLNSLLGYVIAVGNAAILFLAAVGGNETLVEVVKEKPAGVLKQEADRGGSWLRSWFR